MGHHFIELATHYQPIALQMAKRTGQHALRDSVHPTADLCMSKLTINA
jgi:hypothetical protein